MSSPKTSLSSKAPMPVDRRGPIPGRSPAALPEALKGLYDRWENEAFSRIRSVEKGALNWRRIAFLLGYVCLGLLGYLFYSTATFSRAEPALVGYDARSGQAVYLGTASERLKNFTVPPVAIASQLTSFIEKSRRVTMDPPVTVIDRDEVHGMVVGQAGALLARFFKERDTVDHRERVLVNVSSALPIPASKSSWIVDWTERVIDAAGNDISTTDWRGTFVVRLVKVPDQQDKDLRRNPLGIYVADYQWKQLPAGPKAGSPR
jgi:type IV secretory pathway TrbF-like protein